MRQKLTLLKHGMLTRDSPKEGATRIFWSCSQHSWVFHWGWEVLSGPGPEHCLEVGSLHSSRLPLQPHLNHASPFPTLSPLLQARIPLSPNFHLNPTFSVMAVTSSRAPSSHAEAHASFRGPFSSLPSMGDSSPTLAGLPTQISDSIPPCRRSWAHRGREVNGCFKEAEASTPQEHD